MLPWNESTAVLLPCPQCGGGERRLSDDNYFGMLYAVCDGCGHTEPGEVAIENAADFQPTPGCPFCTINLKQCGHCRAEAAHSHLDYDPAADRLFAREQELIAQEYWVATLENGDN